MKRWISLNSNLEKDEPCWITSSPRSAKYIAARGMLVWYGASLFAQGEGINRADLLRDGYGPLRASNRLISYYLDIKVDPARQ